MFGIEKRDISYNQQKVKNNETTIPKSATVTTIIITRKYGK